MALGLGAIMSSVAAYAFRGDDVELFAMPAILPTACSSHNAFVRSFAQPMTVKDQRSTACGRVCSKVFSRVRMGSLHMECSTNTLVAIVLGSLLLCGCVSKTTEKEQYSGYLDRYDLLKSGTSASGAPTLRWVSPAFRAKNYDTVLFDPLTLYPAPKAADRVVARTFHQLRRAADIRVYEVLSKRYRVIGAADRVPFASRLLVLHTAITGVSASNAEIRWYELIPVPGLIAEFEVATGRRDQSYMSRHCWWMLIMNPWLGSFVRSLEKH
ncbi:DUF3313 domain-containing protein [Pseudomonas sp. NPDC098747]|uniref:DUF3313 domain-containing protein n=1 Tax=Pseudomonas sp. NPDC098747 TaxID=3364487 RepID=UPI00383B0C58